ncbi:MAG: phenylalanine--tRNA ligase subunit beta, partial [Clostridia bacterium]|nr:phenylalanine--tRNA ligase subunit beta [Clostridia bacterium]
NCSIDELCAKLVSVGFEVEEVIKQADNCKNCVVGRIEKLEPHPDADKLQVCAINVGSEVLQIVTGASNIKVGDLVPVALDGSDLPCGMHIKKGKLRGVASNGMLCSGEELKVTEEDYKGAGVYGIMILNEDYPLGTDINEVLGTNDVILDVGITANRPDCNSVFGIAREVATVLDAPIKMPSFKYEISKCKNTASVVVENSELCPRYMLSMVKNVVIKPSPKYIQKRLKAVGLRPINNIVDITNYVLMEIGQPMHSFDLNNVANGKIIVRNAKEGEEIVLLNGEKYTLDSSMLVIADSEKPSVIAGIMGGKFSGINENTKEIIFESAKFVRESVRRTSRKLNVRSDSSQRYERGIDLASQELGMKRALQLIYETQSGEICSGIVDVCKESLEPKQVVCKPEKINQILGIEVPEKDMVRILNSLQIQTKIEKGNLVCSVPLYRDDIENANDLAEEIIRLYGYDNITCTLMD